MDARKRILIAAMTLGVWGRTQVAAAPTAPPAASSAEAPARIDHALHRITLAHGEAELHHFTIPLTRVELSFVDLRYETPLVEALGTRDLVLNGGYWGYRGQTRVIEGLLIVNDRRFAAAHRHGGVLELRAGRARVVRGQHFTPAAGTALALQCNPRLVDAGKVVAGLEAVKRAARTALCVGADRGQLHAYLTRDSLTLPELAAFLLSQGCREALNLDGGPSTAAVARRPEGVLTIGLGAALPYGIGFRLREVGSAKR